MFLNVIEPYNRYLPADFLERLNFYVYLVKGTAVDELLPKLHFFIAIRGPVSQPCFAKLGTFS